MPLHQGVLRPSSSAHGGVYGVKAALLPGAGGPRGPGRVRVGVFAASAVPVVRCPAGGELRGGFLLGHYGEEVRVRVQRRLLVEGLEVEHGVVVFLLDFGGCGSGWKFGWGVVFFNWFEVVELRLGWTREPEGTIG